RCSVSRRYRAVPPVLINSTLNSRDNAVANASRPVLSETLIKARRTGTRSAMHADNSGTRAGCNGIELKPLPSPWPCNLSRFCCWETMTQMTRNATDLPFHYPPELELDAPPIEHAHPTDAVRARKRMSGRIIALAAALWLCMLPLRAIVMGYIDPVSYPT